MSTKRVVLAALTTISICGSVNADFVGLNIGANYWTPDLTGSFNSSNAGSIRLNNDLGYTDHSSKSLNISLEHPLPFIPNVKYSGSDLNVSSSATLSSDVSFNNRNYTTGSNISSTLDLSHNDIVLYYELLDNWINVDLGLDLKMFDGKVSINNDPGIEVDETIPMIYLAARFDLPLTGFYVGANIQQLSIGDNSSEDSTLMVGYESKVGLGIEGGIKTFTIDLDDANNLNTNLEYDGLYLNGYFHF